MYAIINIDNTIWKNIYEAYIYCIYLVCYICNLNAYCKYGSSKYLNAYIDNDNEYNLWFIIYNVLFVVFVWIDMFVVYISSLLYLELSTQTLRLLKSTVTQIYITNISICFRTGFDYFLFKIIKNPY